MTTSSTEAAAGPPGPALDEAFVRGCFPALATPWALFDNAGGSVATRPVIEHLSAFLRESGFQLGATYEGSREAARRVAAGRQALAELYHAAPEQLILGASTTVNLRLLAAALAPVLRSGDEVIVTDLDHESNIGPWVALQERGVRLRWWRMRRDPCRLEWEDLEPLLGPRTRLVCYTHCSNLIGQVHDCAAWNRRIRDAGALSCVDGVAAAPHRLPDFEALGADFYCLSLYKTFGPHQGLMIGRPDALARLASQNHFFVPKDRLPVTLEPGNPSYEQTASLVGIPEYLDLLAEHHGLPAGPQGRPAVQDLIQRHEARLMAPLLELLDRHPRVRLFGHAEAHRPDRVPTVSFVVDGIPSEEVTRFLDSREVAVRFGHFYAWRAAEALGVLPQGGVVRVSMLHYNTSREVARLREALEEFLSQADGPPGA